MNTIYKLAFTLALACLSAGCAQLGQTGWTLSPYYQSPLTDDEQAALMSVKDNLVVPGIRAGSVFIGMTDKQLYSKMGNSIESHYGDQNTSSVYTYEKMAVDVNLWTHTVIRAHATDPQYATADGVAVGTSEADAKVKLGAPVLDEPSFVCNSGKYCTDDQKASMSLCYDTGLTVTTIRGVVSTLTVVKPDTCKKS